jgi:hypothetical protein
MKKSLFMVGFLVIYPALFLVLGFLFSGCNTENKVIATVKNSDLITQKLKGYFFDKYPCVNDTVESSTVIQGEPVIKTDTVITYIDGETRIVHDSIYTEKIKVKTVTNTETRIDTLQVVKNITDNRLINFWKDSAQNLAGQVFALTNELKSEKKVSNDYREQRNTNMFILIGSWLLYFVLGYVYRQYHKKIDLTKK